jgi:hypothetical protein
MLAGDDLRCRESKVSGSQCGKAGKKYRKDKLLDTAALTLLLTFGNWRVLRCPLETRCGEESLRGVHIPCHVFLRGVTQKQK